MKDNLSQHGCHWITTKYIILVSWHNEDSYFKLQNKAKCDAVSILVRSDRWEQFFCSVYFFEIDGTIILGKNRKFDPCEFNLDFHVGWDVELETDLYQRASAARLHATCKQKRNHENLQNHSSQVRRFLVALCYSVTFLFGWCSNYFLFIINERQPVLLHHII